MRELRRILKKMLRDHPVTDKFNSEELARWHISYPRRCSNSVVIDGKSMTWIGSRGPLTKAPLGVKSTYLRCAELHDTEEAAKIWAWLQGWIVTGTASYIEDFKAATQGATDE